MSCAAVTADKEFGIPNAVGGDVRSKPKFRFMLAFVAILIANLSLSRAPVIKVRTPWTINHKALLSGINILLRRVLEEDQD